MTRRATCHEAPVLATAAAVGGISEHNPGANTPCRLET